MTSTEIPAPTAHLPGLEPVGAGAGTSARARIARGLFTAAVRRLPVSVEVAAGRRPATVLGRGGPRMVVHRPEEFYARVGRDGLIGFGEAYLTGAWDADDLAGFLTVLASRMARLVPPSLQRLRALVVHKPPHEQKSTQDNTRDNIAHHYDLSNDLFEAFLDPTLSYSAALFDTSLAPSTDEAGPVLLASPPEGTDIQEGAAADRTLADGTLEAAQLRKTERLLDEAGVDEGTHLLEIGTGWGELAIRAAARGATVRSITLSSEQQALARERIAAAGHADRVSVDLCDYRALGDDPATYDAVVSVEMVEAVGHEFWPVYFRTIDRVLRPGGKVAIQAITMPHDRMLTTRHTHTWITKWIFPGGLLPSVRVIDEICREHTGLRITGRLSMGSHYAETLRQWDERFLAALPSLREHGFDDDFGRIWHFYLAYSQAGFAAGYIDDQQLTFTKASIPQGDSA